MAVLSCKKDKNNSGTSNGQATVNNDASSLSSRVSTSDAGVVAVDPTAGGQQKITADSSANEYPMELVASVSAPVHGSDTLRATHVEINGNFAYVSYNTEGPTYKGGIDVFNISTATTPVLVSSVYFPTTDISAVAYYNNRLYVAGARDGETPAVVGYLELSGGLPTSTFVTAGYPGYVGTGLAVGDGKLYLTTGSTGGLYVMNPSNLVQTNTISITDARGVATGPSYVAVQTGTGINLYDRSSYALVRNIGNGPDIPESKRTMEFNGNYLFVASGKSGNRYFDATSGVKVSEISLPLTLSGVLETKDIVTNAVSINNGRFFSANGAAGAYISTENATTHVLTRLGSFGFGTGNSINYVKSKDNYVFVAAGRGGLKIVRFTPTASSSCSTLLNYTGSTHMNVNTGQNLSYGGSLALTTMNVNSNASLFYCGSLAIAENANINSNGILEIQGAMSFGAPGKTLTVNSNATLKISGNVTIYGNLNLNSNAKLVFAGTGNTITIYGTVTKGANVTISGSYTDVNHKL